MVIFGRVLLVCLGLFCFLYGITHVTNIKIEWADPICGFAALVAGVICIIRACMGIGSTV